MIGISINDLRKNLSDINDHMAARMRVVGGSLRDHARRVADHRDRSAAGGRVALAAINTAYNQVSSDISLAQASADQRIVQSRRAVEIETLKAQAEVEPLMAMADATVRTQAERTGVLGAYLRNVRLGLFSQARICDPGGDP